MFNYPVTYINITQDNHSIDNAIDLGWGREHGGPNVPIYAPYKGIVVSTMSNNQGGKRVVTKHELGNYTYYVLQLHFANVLVSVDDEVDQDTILGIMGQTGNATGNHDHVAVFKCPKGTPFVLSTSFYKKYIVDPKEYLFVGSNQTVADKTISKYGDKIRYVLSYEGINYRSTVDHLNIRTGPGTNYAKTSDKQLMLNEKIKVYGKCNGWYLISIEEQKWVSGDYIEEYEEKKESKLEKFINFIKKAFKYLKKIINMIR